MQIPNFLTHYYEKNDGAFRSMTDDGEERAREIFTALKQGGKSIKSKFQDFYVDLRYDVEDWLRTEFRKKGGVPVRQNPIYTVLGKCEHFQKWYEECAKETIPLSSLKGKQVSFTYTDSMVSYQLGFQKYLQHTNYEPKEYYGKLYLLEELPKIIEQYGLPKGQFRNGRPDYDMYLEVQIWEELTEPSKNVV